MCASDDEPGAVVLKQQGGYEAARFQKGGRTRRRGLLGTIDSVQAVHATCAHLPTGPAIVAGRLVVRAHVLSLVDGLADAARIVSEEPAVDHDLELHAPRIEGKQAP